VKKITAKTVITPFMY